MKAQTSMRRAMDALLPVYWQIAGDPLGFASVTVESCYGDLRSPPLIIGLPATPAWPCSPKSPKLCAMTQRLRPSPPA